jgi:hypothetical protein
MKNNWSGLPQHIEDKIFTEPNSGCWLWTANQLPRGYGQLKYKRRCSYSHRVVYEILVGPIPKGLHIDHLCRTPSCCNPDHLEPVTHLENVRRGDAGQHHARKEECPHGHPYTEENTRRNEKGRWCRACAKRSSLLYMRRIRAEAKAKRVCL